MTTRVTVACQQDSHWDVKVTTQDQVFDAELNVMTEEWQSVAYVEPIVLGPGEVHETYLTSSRRLLVEEVERK